MSIDVNDEAVLPIIVSTNPSLLINNGHIDTDTPQDTGGNNILDFLFFFLYIFLFFSLYWRGEYREPANLHQTRRTVLQGK